MVRILAAIAACLLLGGGVSPAQGQTQFRASPQYHQYLTVSEFTARFGPSQQDYDAVVSFAQANGLTVIGGW